MAALGYPPKFYLRSVDRRQSARSGPSSGKSSRKHCYFYNGWSPPKRTFDLPENERSLGFTFDTVLKVSTAVLFKIWRLSEPRRVPECRSYTGLCNEGSLQKTPFLNFRHARMASACSSTIGSCKFLILTALGSQLQ